jgi:hypothetical protein
MIDSSSSKARGSRYGTLALLAILAIGLLLRLEDIKQPLVDHFSWREASTAMMADNLPNNSWNPFWPEVSWTGDQPGYQGRELQSLSVAAAALDALFGWRDWHGRAVAAVCGVLSIFAFYRIVVLIAGRRQALIAAGLYAVSPGAVFIDRSYLPEPAMLTFILFGTWFVAEGLAQRRAAILIAGWFFVTLGLLAKLTAVAALPAVFYLVLFGVRPFLTARKVLFLALALCVSVLIVFSYYRWAVYLGRSYPPFHVAGRGWLWDEGFQSFWDNAFYLDIFKWHAFTWLWGGLIVGLAFVGFWLPTPRSADETGAPPLKAPLFFQAWTAGAAILYVLAAFELRDNSWNLHIFNPAVVGLAAGTLGWLGWLTRRLVPRLREPELAHVAEGSMLIATMVLIVVSTRTGVEFMRDSRYAREDYRMGAKLSELSCPGELVVVSGTDVGSPIAIYYSRRRGFVFPTPESVPDYGIYMSDGTEAIDLVRGLVNRGARWFAFAQASRDNLGRYFVAQHQQLIAFLKENAELVDANPEFTIFDLSRLSGKPPACVQPARHAD